MTGSIAASGDVTSLTNGTGGNADLKDNSYSNMFKGCTALTVAPNLPSTTLVDGCYSNMFNGCIALEAAPALPAERLANQCYGNMFSGCAALTAAPALPATTLVIGCYYYMFAGCTSLTVAPALPATTLAQYCYNYMFSGCTALTTPAMMNNVSTLAEKCCMGMYGSDGGAYKKGCENLKIYTSPDSETGCTKAWKAANTTAEAENWATDMFKDCGATVTTVTAGTTYYIFEPNICIGAQTGTLTYGTGGSVTYTLTFKGWNPTCTVNWTETPTGVTYSVSNGVLTFTVPATTDAGQYPFTVTATEGGNTATAEAILTISPIKLTVSTVTTANGKTYDGTAAAEIGTQGTFSGILEGDAVTVTPTAEFQDVNAGNGRNVTITYSLIGDDAGNYEAPDSATTVADIGRRPVTLTSVTDSKKYDGTPLTNGNVSVTGDGWAADEGATYDVTGTQTAVGSSSNTFTYTLNDGTEASNYNITTEYGTLTVTENDTLITITADSAEKTYDGTALTKNGYTYTGSLAAGDSFTSVPVTGTITDAGTAANKVTTYTIQNTNGENVTAFYSNVQTVDGTLTVNRRSVTLTSATDSKEYDGTALTNSTVTVSGNGFVEGEGATYTVTGTQTFVGSSDNAFTYKLNENTKAGNYEIAEVKGKLEVTGRTAPLTITVEDQTKTYDGTAALSDGDAYTVSGDVATGDRITITLSTDKVDAGTYTKAITATYKIMHGDTDVTDMYLNVSVNLGDLTVNKRSVTLTSGDGSKKYDGTALTNSTVTVSGDGFVEGEGATYAVTGTQTAVGSSSNTFTYTLNNDTKANNYDITKTEGTLTVMKNDTLITITADSAEKTYDGTALTKSTYTHTGSLATGDSFTSVTVTGTITDAGTAANKVTGYTIKNSSGDDVTAFYSNIQKADSTLTVNKRSITLTSATDSKEYDGTPLTNENVSVTGDGWATGEGATYSDFASITGVGTASNAFVYTLNNDTKAANYGITVVSGILTVTPQKLERLPQEVRKKLGTKLNIVADTAVENLSLISAFNGNGIEAAESSSITQVLGNKGFVEVLLKGVGFDCKADELTAESEIVTAKFDVTPYGSDRNPLHTLDQAVTFRLPLISTEYAYANVSHDGAFYRQIVVDKSKNYIEVTANKYSEYSYTLTNIPLYTEPSTYAITVEEAEHGTVTADLKKASYNKVVTLTVTPDTGYTLETLTVRNGAGKELELALNEDGTYTFKMSYSKVTVTATFMEDNTMLNYFFDVKAMEDNTMLNYFFDVKAEDYFYDAVLWATENGITNGAEPNYFKPTGITTRAQMVTFLWRAAGSPEPTAPTCKFTDIAADAYYYKAVLWAVEKGITSGTSETTFEPDATVTRAQTVTFLWRYEGSKTASGKNVFTDVATDAYYYNAVLWAKTQGITSGTSDTTFSPNASCTRGQVVTFLYNDIVK